MLILTCVLTVTLTSTMVILKSSYIQGLLGVGWDKYDEGEGFLTSKHLK